MNESKKAEINAINQAIFELLDILFTSTDNKTSEVIFTEKYVSTLKQAQNSHDQNLITFLLTLASKAYKQLDNPYLQASYLEAIIQHKKQITSI